MKPTRRLQPAPVTAPDETHDLSGLIEQRAQALRALEQTRAAQKTEEIARAGESAVRELETAVAGRPEPGPPGWITARVVATGQSERGVPPIPLADLPVRLKVAGEVVREGGTDRLGMVGLELPKERFEAYELEVVGPDCQVIACQAGRWSENEPASTHLFEVPRTEALAPQLERARPFELGIRKARERAALAREVVTKALAAQETRLQEYLAEIEAALACEPEPGQPQGGTEPPSASGPARPEPKPDPAPPPARDSAPQNPPRREPTRPAPERPAAGDKTDTPPAKSPPEGKKPGTAAPPGGTAPAKEPGRQRRRGQRENPK